MIVYRVSFSPGHALAYVPYCEVGKNGLQRAEVSRSGKARSMLATRRRASASRGVISFQMPQMFSHDSYPAPLKNAYCRLSVLFLFQRSHTLTMWRGSSHL